MYEGGDEGKVEDEGEGEYVMGECGWREDEEEEESE